MSILVLDNRGKDVKIHQPYMARDASQAATKADLYKALSGLHRQGQVGQGPSHTPVVRAGI